MDDFIDVMLKTAQEALSWLQGSTDSCERALGEMTYDEAVAEIQKLYALGATKVWVVEIEEDEDLEESGKLVVELPKNKESRADVFEWSAYWATTQGFDPETDTGQAHVFVMLD